jgi:hypothetical protein
VKTVVLGSRPPELEALIEKRRRLGQDSFDEIWQGDYHMVPAPSGRHSRLEMDLARLLWPSADAAGLIQTGPFNIGVADDCRIPDQGYHRVRSDDVWFATAAVVVEIRSAGDETYEKFDFYARHDVDEIVVVEPDDERVLWFVLRDGAYIEVERSEVLGVTTAEVESQLDW